jgi:hypothetical protein
MKLVLFIFSISICYSSFRAPQNDRKIFEKLYALQGTWKMENSKGILYESWHRIQDTLMQGGSYKVNNHDTTFFERVALKYSNGKVFYVPLVEENNMEPVSFTLTSNNNNSFVFENPQHDFPKRIIYEIIAPDSLHAYIDDGVNNPSKRKDYFYKKVN